VPPTHAIYQTEKIIGELDFAYQFLPKDFKIISITGTDGKSTTTWIMYELLRQELGDKNVFLSGNFDIPFSATVLEILIKNLKRGHIVTEISSFMAYNIKNFTSEYSIFTNLEPDHLNWHAGMADYFASKWKVFENTRKTRILHTSIEKRLEEFGISSRDNIRYYSAEKT
jgi:UDP-N-acetylmuramoylalanine--D-glutamate ligase